MRLRLQRRRAIHPTRADSTDQCSVICTELASAMQADTCCIEFPPLRSRPKTTESPIRSGCWGLCYWQPSGLSSPSCAPRTARQGHGQWTNQHWQRELSWWMALAVGAAGDVAEQAPTQPYARSEPQSYPVHSVCAGVVASWLSAQLWDDFHPAVGHQTTAELARCRSARNPTMDAPLGCRWL